MADDLKLCPFCGGEAHLRDDVSHSRAYFIGCNVEDCFGEIHWEQSRDKAIAAWNRRATPTVQEAAKVLLDALNTSDGFRAAVNAAMPLLRDDIDQSAWNTAGEVVLAISAAVRAFAGEIHD